MENLIEFIAKKLVEHPEDVEIRKIESEGDQNYELRVNESDMGRVIGRSGRTAKAMRTVLAAAASKSNIHANLEIVE